MTWVFGCLGCAGSGVGDLDPDLIAGLRANPSKTWIQDLPPTYADEPDLRLGDLWECTNTEDERFDGLFTLISEADPPEWVAAPQSSIDLGEVA